MLIHSTFASQLSIPSRTQIRFLSTLQSLTKFLLASQAMTLSRHVSLLKRLVLTLLRLAFRTP
jgi:hypothetical protein